MMQLWGPARDVLLDDLKPSARQVLHVPEAMKRLSNVNIPSGKILPLFSIPIENKWFKVPQSNAASLENAKAKAFAFHFRITGWK